MSDTASKTIGRASVNGDYVEITATIRENDPTLSDGFSITCDIWEKRGTWDGRAAKRNGREPNSGGAAHDVILRVAPNLKPLVVAHLADLDGTPMHAEVNGWYFYVGAARDYDLKAYGQDYVDRMGTDRERAARALHIDVADLPSDLDRDGFARFCESLKPVWAEQAREARAAFDAMVDGAHVEQEA